MSETEPAASEVTSRRLLRNTVVNGLANVSGALVTAVLTPFLLHRLGTQEYGVWLLALGVTFSSGYLSLADIGLTEATVKFIAEARAVGSIRTVNEIASTTIAAFAAVGVVVGGGMALLAPILVGLFDVQPGLVDTARVVFALMALEVVIALPAAALRAVVEGAQDYTRLRAIDIASSVLFGVAVIAAVSDGHGVVAMAMISLVVAGLRAVAALVVAHRAQVGLELRPGFVSWQRLRTSSSYGSYVGGLRLLGVVYGQMDRFIIGIAVAVSAVATYEVAYRMQSIAILVLTMASSAVLPAAAYNAARADTDKQRELYLRGTKYTFALVLPVTIAAFLYAEPLIRVWVGSHYVSMTTPTRLFLIFPAFACANQVGVSMLVGLGRVRRVLLYQFVAVALNLVVSLALAPSLGIRGVIIGTLVGGLSTWYPYLRLLLGTFETDLRAWTRRCVRPSIPGAAAQVALGLLSLRWAAHLDRLWQVLLLCGASCGLNLGLFVFAGLERPERRHLIERFVS